MLIDNDYTNGIHESEKIKLFDRSLICLLGSKKVIFIQTSKASLFELSERFGANDEKSIIKCKAVIKFDGHESYGVLINSSSGLKRYGKTDSLIASSLYVIAMNRIAPIRVNKP